MTCTTYGELQNGTNRARPLARKEAEAHRPELLDGVGLIVGIDRFMSEARAVTNFSGNAMATLLVGSWTKTVDAERVVAVLGGQAPFDEITMLDDADTPGRPATVG